MTLDIDTRARHFPDRTAVVDHTADETWTYADLAAESEAAAGRLVAHGVDAGDRVVVLSRNRPDLLALFFGARRLGATLAPISFRLSADVVADLVDRIDPALVVHEERFADLVPDRDSPSVTLADFRGTDPADLPEARPATAEPAASPLFLHTGGTTGVPKVVPISDRQVEWNCITESAAWGLGRETVSPLLLPQFHTGGWNLLALPSLYAGGTVVLQRAFDPGEALAMVEAYGATQLFGVAAIFDAMADHSDFADTDFSSVDWVMSGGGPTPEAVMEPYRERGIDFVQGYGLTEGGPNNLYLDPARDVDKPGSVGRPFPDCEARIVDDAGEPVEQGETGELELAGPVTADGYLATEDGTFDGRWVSTGDLARQDADGDYYITGRVDDMFVSGGENVHPQAVEDVLSDHPDVEAVGVVGIPHEKWGTVPKAVVVGQVSADELEAFARERLADYEVPHEFAFVDELPQTGPGKLDRDALRDVSPDTDSDTDPDP